MLDVSDLIAVDLFAGCGGLTEGAEQAGACVAVALNHWEFAVTVHALNHPNTRHVLQDVRQAEWRDLPAFHLLMGGASCQGHSSAGVARKHKDPAIAARVQAKHEVDRSTAWAMIDAAEVCRPDWVLAENVLQWLKWPLFDLWREALHRLGYVTRVMVLAADRYGVPQARKRVFVVAHRDADAVEHVVRTVKAKAAPDAVQSPGACTIVDFAAGRWKDAEQCGKGSRARILAGLALGTDQWWCQHVSHHRGKPMTVPFSTITGADQHVLCRRRAGRVEYRTLLPGELLAAQGFAPSYRLPSKYVRRDLTRAVGNAVPVDVARTLVAAIKEAT